VLVIATATTFYACGFTPRRRHAATAHDSLDAQVLKNITDDLDSHSQAIPEEKKKQQRQRQASSKQQQQQQRQRRRQQDHQAQSSSSPAGAEHGLLVEKDLNRPTGPSTDLDTLPECFLASAAVCGGPDDTTAGDTAGGGAEGGVGQTATAMRLQQALLQVIELAAGIA
jgi:hypothetical protein